MEDLIALNYIYHIINFANMVRRENENGAVALVTYFILPQMLIWKQHFLYVRIAGPK